jgi:Fur family transcriptional regulator, ferric uptake regulator
MTDIIARCEAKGLRMTDQRRVVARVIGEAEDHPDVEELYARAAPSTRASPSPRSIAP